MNKEQIIEILLTWNFWEKVIDTGGVEILSFLYAGFR